MNMKNNTLMLSGFIFAFSALAIPSITIADATTTTIANIPADFKFTKNMRYKDTIAPDIAYLQRVLNSDVKTRVAETGNGSNQSPTTYFGSKTLDAVKRFQELYKSEVLTPAGLSSATGYIGQYTIKKLNSLLSGMQNASTTSSVNIASSTKATSTSTSASASIKHNSNLSTNGSASMSGSETRQMLSLSSYNAVSGDSITIIGTGFHPSSNSVYLGPVLIGKYASQKSGAEIKFSIPSNISSGSYQVSISSDYGNIISKSLYLDITNTKFSTTLFPSMTSSSGAQSSRPVLYSLSPYSSDSFNSVIRIFGKNFPASGNTVMTNFGNISNLSSSNGGMTIDFTAGSIPGYKNAFNLYKGGTFPLLISVNGSNGTSTNILWHLLTFPNISSPKIADGSQLSSEMTKIDQATKDFLANVSILNPTINPYEDLVNQLDPSLKELTNPLVSNKNLINRFTATSTSSIPLITSSSTSGVGAR